MDAFIGEICLFAPTFAPRGWVFCRGQLLPINQNQALFSLLGTTYGGDGRVNFALPNLIGRSAMGFGQGSGLTDRILGEIPGTTTNTISISQMPAHTHTLSGTLSIPATNSTGNQQSPAAGYFASDGTQKYDIQQDGVTMQPATLNLTVGNTGTGIPITNMMPYLALNYIICLSGIFPPRS
jgi:microcystin-dependent protein